MKRFLRWLFRKFLGEPHFLVLVGALVLFGAPSADAQGCFGPGCGGSSSGGGVTPATLNDATYCPDLGVFDAYVCSMVSTPSSYAPGMLVTLSANTANTGTASVNVNSLGVKTITRMDGSTLVTGDILATMPVLLEYDGTNFRLLSSPAAIRSLSDNGSDLTTARRLVPGGLYVDLGGGVNMQAITSGTPNYALLFGTSGGVAFGAGGNGAAFIRGHGTVSGVMQISPATATNYIEMVEVADARANYDFNIACITGLGTSGCTDPTFSIRSANQATNQAFSLGHNQTQGVITANGGVLARSLTYASGSDVALTVQGSLTGNIQNWKNSAGTLLSQIDVSGYFRAPRYEVGGAAVYIKTDGGGSLNLVTSNKVTGNDNSSLLLASGGNGTAGQKVAMQAYNGTAWSDGFSATNVASGTIVTSWNGNPTLERTVTVAGTTGGQTINKMAGTVNFAAAATAITVTNSLVNTSSIIFTTIRTADTTCTFVKSVVPGSGSFVITLNAGCNAETSVGFWVTN